MKNQLKLLLCKNHCNSFFNFFQNSVQQSFNDIKESRSFLLNDKIQHSMDYLLDNFDCFTEDGDDKEEEKDFEARTVNIMNVVQFGEAIGRGKYGIVRKGIYLDTNEVVAVKIIQKNEQQPRDIECIKVSL